MVITIPFDPVLLRIGGLSLHWYGVAYAVAFLVGIRIVAPYGRRMGVSDRDAGDFFFWTIVMGLVGGRLYFVLQQPNLRDFLMHPIRIIAVWEGGMAFFGAIIAACSTLAYLAYRKRISVWVALDGGALFAGVPQAIGRIGNIINGDILGPPSHLPWAVRYTSPDTFAPAVGVSYQPANFYELLAALLMALLVLFIIRRGARPGTAIIAYVAAYAVSQFLLFFVRATEPVVLFGLKQAQVTALVMLFVFVPILLALRRAYPSGFADRANAGARSSVLPPLAGGGEEGGS